MARTRIILGYQGSKSLPVIIYAGKSGTDAEQAMKQNTTCMAFEIFEGLGRRKNNSNFKPSAADAAAAVEAEPQPSDNTAIESTSAKSATRRKP